MAQTSQTFRDIRLKIPGECDGDFIYVSKRAYKGIVTDKKIEITSIKAIGRTVEIAYRSKRNASKGCMTLNDLGPKNEKGI